MERVFCESPIDDVDDVHDDSYVPYLSGSVDEIRNNDSYRLHLIKIGVNKGWFNEDRMLNLIGKETSATFFFYLLGNKDNFSKQFYNYYLSLSDCHKAPKLKCIWALSIMCQKDYLAEIKASSSPEYSSIASNCLDVIDRSTDVFYLQSLEFIMKERLEMVKSLTGTISKSVSCPQIEGEGHSR